MPIQSFSTATTTFVGQNMGAGRMDRVKQGARSALVLSTVVCMVITAAVIPLRRPLLMLFNRESAVLAAGEAYLLRVVSPMFVLAIMFILSSVLRGAGATMVAMVASVVSQWGARVPAAYLLAHFFGPEELYWSYLIGWILGLAICLVVYVRGNWKNMGVVERRPELE